MMTIRTTLATVLGTATIGLAGCAGLQKNTSSGEALSQPSPAAVNAAASQNASGVAQVSFAQNSATLTEEARHTLVDTLNSAEKTGSVGDVKILAWSDKNYPNDSQADLSKSDRKLADQRADAVRSFLKSISTDLKSVDTYNMASRPNGVARLFKTDDDRVKAEMEKAGLSGSVVDQATAPKSSTAVVMFLNR